MCEFPDFTLHNLPKFHEYSDLSVHFRNGEVHNKSALFSPVDIENAGVIDYFDNRSIHSIAYKESWPCGWLCSEKTLLEEYNIDEITKISDIGAEPSESVTTEKVDTLFNSLAEVLDTHDYIRNRDIVDSEVNRIRAIVENFEDPECPHNLPKIQAISFISRNFLGSEMLFSCRSE